MTKGKRKFDCNNISFSANDRVYSILDELDHQECGPVDERAGIARLLHAVRQRPQRQAALGRLDGLRQLH